MSPETADSDPLQSIEDHLRAALDNTTNDDVRFHLREALQITYGETESEE
jgi:hypothetical protein